MRPRSAVSHSIIETAQRFRKEVRSVSHAPTPSTASTIVISIPAHVDSRTVSLPHGLNLFKLPPQRQNMLRQTTLPTKRTLWLLPRPIPNTRPAKHMPARRHTRIPHPLQTQRALPIILAYPLHRLLVAKLIPRLIHHRRIRPLLKLCRQRR